MAALQCQASAIKQTKSNPPLSAPKVPLTFERQRGGLEVVKAESVLNSPFTYLLRWPVHARPGVQRAPPPVRDQRSGWSPVQWGGLRDTPLSASGAPLRSDSAFTVLARRAVGGRYLEPGLNQNSRRLPGARCGPKTRQRDHLLDEPRPAVELHERREVVESTMRLRG